MIIGVPKELKPHEYRVGLTPDVVKVLVSNGHRVLVESGAGTGIFESDDAYRAQGGEIKKNAKALFDEADLIVKVKEPTSEEAKMLSRGQILFAFLHLAANKSLTEQLVASGADCIAYEMVCDAEGNLPLLKPMSTIAGRLATQVAAELLTRPKGGNGKLIGGLPGVEPAKLVILGGGVVGTNAAKIALGMGARVVLLESNTEVMERAESQFEGRLITTLSSVASIERHISNADIVIGATLRRGAAADKIISAPMVKMMREHSIIVDVAIDQGGCVETSRPTTHAEPTFEKYGVLHYCVTNMPGITPHTSTFALSNATSPYLIEIANKGWEQATIDNPGLLNAISIARNRLFCEQTASAHGMTIDRPLSEILDE